MAVGWKFSQSLKMTQDLVEKQQERFLDEEIESFFTSEKSNKSSNFSLKIWGGQ